MEQRKKIGKFNIFVGLLVLIAVVLWGGYFIVNKQNNAASISRQVTQILEENIKPVASCQANPNNQTQDSDNDGLKDWEELTWGTDPCIPDSDKDGYLDGEEVSAGYNPLQPSPGDKLPERETSSRSLPKNLTQALAQDLAKKTVEGKIEPMNDDSDFAVLDSNYPVISSAIQEIMNQSYEDFVLPQIEDGEIVVSDSNSQEAIEIYMQNISKIMSKWAKQTGINSEAYETETHLFYDAISTNNFTEVEKYIKFYDEIYKEIKQLPVPSSFTDIHKEQLGIFWIMKNIYKAVSQIENDPIKASLALNQYSNANDLADQLTQKIINRLQIQVIE